MFAQSDVDYDGVWRVLADHDPDRCTVAPSPELADKLRAELTRISSARRVADLPVDVSFSTPAHPGLNDGLIVPGSYFPLGTSVDRVRSAAADRAPLRGTVRVIVVLVDFPDKAMTAAASHFEELFFSTGVLANGSVKEYYAEVTNGLVDITGQVVGPYRMPRPLTDYANAASGTGSAAPNARTMARDAAVAADAAVNFGPYDNDGNGFVDAFIVIHAGAGAEVTGSTGDIWSHKWVLAGGEYATDNTKIYGYLTVPEDAKIGVCAHELGHLLFGFPDLYDADGGSEGLGNWCLMAGGSWNGGGDIPAHPSAWCKAQQGWVAVNNLTTNANLTIADVKDTNTVHRLWKDGAAGQEYFLVENRQRTRYDAQLPGDGLLIWHVDEAIADNTNPAHYRVALMQADGQQDLEHGANRGDAGDPFPGTANNRSFTATTNPNSKSYGGLATCVSITAISDSGPVMSAQVQVQCGKSVQKDVKDFKDSRKDVKDFDKPLAKDRLPKERIKDFIKDFDKRPEKPDIDKRVGLDKPFDQKPGDGKLPDGKFRDGKVGDGKLAEGPFGAPTAGVDPLEERVAMLEAIVFGSTEPFIGDELRPDLQSAALLGEPDSFGGAVLPDKRAFDAKPSDAR